MAAGEVDATSFGGAGPPYPPQLAAARAALRELAAARRALDEVEPALVAWARLEGALWQEIAHDLGIARTTLSGRRRRFTHASAGK